MEALRQYLEKQNLSQSEFAKLLRVSQATVSDWLRGETYPNTQRLPEIAEIIGVTVDELLKGRVA